MATAPAHTPTAKASRRVVDQMRTCVPASAHSAVCSDRRTERETQDLQLKTWGFVLSKNHGVWRHRAIVIKRTFPRTWSSARASCSWALLSQSDIFSISVYTNLC
eukprot:5562444-Prymnesium_polylepis.1